VIGGTASGGGSNTVTIGNANITNTYLKGTVNCPSLTTTGNIALPTTLTTPISGQLGYTVTGTFNPDSKLTARISPCSGYLSKLVLPVGVWLIQATAGVLCTAGGNNMNPFSIQISAIQNTGADSAAGSAVVFESSNEFSGTSVFDDTVPVASMLKANSVFANYIHLGGKGSEATSKFASLGNETGDWGGTWIDYNRDNDLYKTYFINQRKSNTTTSGEIPGGFRFMTYDENNEAIAYPLDIMHDTITSHAKFYSSYAHLGELTVGEGDTTSIAKLMMKSSNSNASTYDTLIQSICHDTATTNGQGALTFKSLSNKFDSYLEVPNIQISGTSTNTFY